VAQQRPEHLWHRVWLLAEKVKGSATEGAVAVVDIEMVNGHSFRPAVLQERPPWIVIEIPEPGAAMDDTSAREVVFLLEDHIAEIRISQEPAAENPLGFSLGEVEGTD